MYIAIPQELYKKVQPLGPFPLPLSPDQDDQLSQMWYQHTTTPLQLLVLV